LLLQMPPYFVVTFVLQFLAFATGYTYRWHVKLLVVRPSFVLSIRSGVFIMRSGGEMLQRKR
jgi:hypothetical protein